MILAQAAVAAFDWSPVIGVGALIACLIAAAGVAGGQFRISRNTAIVADYREAAAASKAKAEALESEIADLRDENTAKDKQIADLQLQVNELRGHMQALQEMMVGASALDTIRGHISSARDDIIAAIAGAKS